MCDENKEIEELAQEQGRVIILGWSDGARAESIKQEFLRPTEVDHTGLPAIEWPMRTRGLEKDCPYCGYFNPCGNCAAQKSTPDRS
jgi:hypothetical protein